MLDMIRKPRHRAATPGVSLGGVMKTCGAITGAIIVAVGISGGSFALWVDADSASAGTVSSGSASLSITQSVNPALWGNMLAGESVRQQFTVTNTGTVPLTLAGSASTATTAMQVRIASGACPAIALGGTSATVSPAALGSLAAGATATVCLEVSLEASAPLGTSSAVSVILSGTQA